MGNVKKVKLIFSRITKFAKYNIFKMEYGSIMNVFRKSRCVELLVYTFIMRLKMYLLLITFFIITKLYVYEDIYIKASTICSNNNTRCSLLHQRDMMSCECKLYTFCVHT